MPDLNLNAQAQPPQNSNAPQKVFSVVKIGFLEGFFVICTLILIFFLLNFLNILQIDKTFPFMSFLPHLSSPTTANPQVNTKPSSPNLPIEATAKQEIYSLVTHTLQTQYIPPEVYNNSEKLLFNSATINHYYYYMWGGGSSGAIAYNVNSDPINYLQTSIVASNSSSFSSIAPKDADAITAKYFNIHGDFNYFSATDSAIAWNCTTVGQSSSYCQKFYASKMGKFGYGVETTLISGSYQTSVYTCFIPSTSTMYAKASACIVSIVSG